MPPPKAPGSEGEIPAPAPKKPSNSHCGSCRNRIFTVFWFGVPKPNACPANGLPLTLWKLKTGKKMLDGSVSSPLTGCVAGKLPAFSAVTVTRTVFVNETPVPPAAPAVAWGLTAS